MCTYASPSPEASEDLRFCCQALGEIGQCYRNATRALEVIINVKHEWQKLAATRATSVATKRSGCGIGVDVGWDDSNRNKKKMMQTSSSLHVHNFQTPATSDTIRNLGSDVTLQSADVYDAWQFLNWAEIGVDLAEQQNGANSTKI